MNDNHRKQELRSRGRISQRKICGLSLVLFISLSLIAALSACAPVPMAQSAAPVEPPLPPLPYEKVPAYWPDPKLPPPKWPQAHPDAKPDPGMNRFQYWHKLCQLEAGEFIAKTVDDVEGVYLIRPMFVADDRFGIAGEMLLYRRYEIEDPFTAWTTLFLSYSKFILHAGTYGFAEIPVVDFERDLPNARPLYSGGQPVPHPFIVQREATWDPKWKESRIYIDLMVRRGGQGPYLRYTEDKGEPPIDEALKADTGRIKKLFPRRIEERVPTLKSRYGVYWRGIRRPQDREMGIGGGEIFVIDLATNEILGYRRGFVLAWESADKRHMQWRSQAICPGPWHGGAESDDILTKVLKPRWSPRNRQGDK